MKHWKVLESEKLIDNRWITVRKDKVDLPNGVRIDDFYSVTIPDAALIVAVTSDRKIVLKKEFKYATGEELIECPAGMFETHETDGLEVAKRELREETGYESDEWQYLGATLESSSKLTNRMHLYFANHCRKVGEQHLDETEEVEVLVVPFADAIDMVMKNEICCNSTAHGILKVARILEY